MSEGPKGIAERRKAKGYSQKRFAESIGISHPSMIKFEKGSTDKIPIGIAREMANLLDTSISELCGIEDFGSNNEELEEFKQEIFLETKKFEGYINQKDKHISLLEKQLDRKFADILNSALALGDMMDYYLDKESERLGLNEQGKMLVSEKIRAAHFVAMDVSFLQFLGTPEEQFRKEHGDDVPFPGEDPEIEYFRDVLKKVRRFY